LHVRWRIVDCATNLRSERNDARYVYRLECCVGKTDQPRFAGSKRDHHGELPGNGCTATQHWSNYCANRNFKHVEYFTANVPTRNTTATTTSGTASAGSY
jgi:hypothetical protein